MVGPITVEPARLIIPGGFFSSGTELQTQPVVVDIKPLPANAPASFNGAVGQFTLSRLHLGNTQPEAVVVAQEVGVTSGPGSQYVIEFTLHSGTEVGLVETRKSWARLALSSGELQGWVPASAVETVAASR